MRLVDVTNLKCIRLNRAEERKLREYLSEGFVDEEGEFYDLEEMIDVHGDVVVSESDYHELREKIE